jgi:hypothetical protein
MFAFPWHRSDALMAFCVYVWLIITVSCYFARTLCEGLEQLNEATKKYPYVHKILTVVVGIVSLSGGVAMAYFGFWFVFFRK